MAATKAGPKGHPPSAAAWSAGLVHERPEHRAPAQGWAIPRGPLHPLDGSRLLVNLVKSQLTPQAAPLDDRDENEAREAACPGAT